MKASPLETFLVFLKLGTTCFGGPIAHLGYFRNEFVVRRKWLDDSAFADIVALCQFLPGPASSQMGLVIGMHRAGWWGALGAWLGFTMPSALLMIAFGYSLGYVGDLAHAGWLEGLKLAALAIVAQAVWAMASKFCIERSTASIAVGAAITVIVWPIALAQLIVISAGACWGWFLYRKKSTPENRNEDSGHLSIPYGPRQGLVMLIAFFILLFGLPVLAELTGNSMIATFERFYRTGALVFGGGHVVLPLLHDSVVEPGFVSNDTFLAGYGAAQAVPGPLFSFAAFLGTVMKVGPTGWIGGLWCLWGIYVPAALLVFGTLPFWESLRRKIFAKALLKGANASVVGILLAALYQPVWTSSVHGPIDFCIGLAAFALLDIWKVAPWIVVGLSAVSGIFLFR